MDALIEILYLIEILFSYKALTKDERNLVIKHYKRAMAIKEWANVCSK